MPYQNIQRKTITAYILTAVYILILTFSHKLDLLLSLNYLVSITLIIVLFVTMVVLYARSILVILKNREQLSLKLFMPVIIYSVAWVFTGFSGSLPNDRTFESKSALKAYYYATGGGSFVNFKIDKTFELNTTGPFGYNKWYTGTYTAKGDTLFLTYSHGNPLFGKVFLNKTDSLYVLDKPRGSNQHFPALTIDKPKHK